MTNDTNEDTPALERFLREAHCDKPHVRFMLKLLRRYRGLAVSVPLCFKRATLPGANPLRVLERERTFDDAVELDVLLQLRVDAVIDSKHTAVEFAENGTIENFHKTLKHWALKLSREIPASTSVRANYTANIRRVCVVDLLDELETFMKDNKLPLG